MFISSLDAQYQEGTCPEITPKGREKKADKGKGVRKEKEPRDWPINPINQEVTEANINSTNVNGSLRGLLAWWDYIIFSSAERTITCFHPCQHLSLIWAFTKKLSWSTKKWQFGLGVSLRWIHQPQRAII